MSQDVHADPLVSTGRVDPAQPVVSTPVQGGPSADARALLAYEANKKSTGAAYLLWFFLGGLGGHRFYMGRVGSGIGMAALCLLGFVTLGITFIPLAIWVIIDAFLLAGMVRNHNRKVALAAGAGGMIMDI
ncbi:TM2 domain-containing protein [Consotaella aegiceratis]|uniref:TM2 domain-containing protein n=1 Tax=Consotaella aegiceratis TaxID=3097961 RepID=UPI002F3F074B